MGAAAPVGHAWARLMKLAAFIFLTGLVVNGTAGAADYPAACKGFSDFLRGSIEQPVKPACVDALYSKVDIEFCQPQMDLYQQTIRHYVECLKAENDSVIATFNAAAARFNCAQQAGAC
jgi:hypothetical protein